MTAFHRLRLSELVGNSVNGIVGELARHQPGVTPEQIRSWEDQVVLLRTSAEQLMAVHPSAANWWLLLEYQMIRLQRRIDAVILADEVIFSLEFKMGGDRFESADKRQADDYALDLRDFHEGSQGFPIVPVLCVSGAPSVYQQSLLLAHSIAPLLLTNADNLAAECLKAYYAFHQDQLPYHQITEWESSAYKPVPSIIEAAEAIYASTDVRAINCFQTDIGNLGATTSRLIEIIADARSNNKHIVCFVTGVPGSGKTLVGLNAVNDPRFRAADEQTGTFLSGNTPLVAVLKAALSQDYRRRHGGTIKAAEATMRTKIQNLMRFLEDYLDHDIHRAPHEKAVVFDEAQRAWNEEYGRRKFGRESSEPALFISIMSRHQDWAVIVALVGGGQEIHSGEGGLALWGEALTKANAVPGVKSWEVIASPHVITGTAITAGSVLFPDGIPSNVLVSREDALHLPVSIRSHRCEVANAWIDAVLDGNRFKASSIARELQEFPIYITRSKQAMIDWLRLVTRGNRRCGLIASSGARRLRGYGLGVSLGAMDLHGVADWFLRPPGDVRASYSLELTANEFACQGLELDTVGLCWGGDFTWGAGRSQWNFRAFKGSKWQNVNQVATKENIRNKYRVLLSRARESLVIWVPPGDPIDSTRPAEWMDQTAVYLEACGIRKLPNFQQPVA